MKAFKELVDALEKIHDDVPPQKKVDKVMSDLGTVVKHWQLLE